MSDKKTIWIINHYATNMFKDKGGRHYWIAKYLLKQGYRVRVFCSSQVHNSDVNYIVDGSLYKEETIEGIDVTYVKTRKYTGNGKSRILNMVDFYWNVKKIAHNYEKPYCIIGSSVHPLTCVAAIKISHKLKCKNIVEIRDLWPESIVAYGLLKKNSLIAKILYRGEKWIYKNADKIIMTWPGGYDYIENQGWNTVIPEDKVVHISNGIDNESFNNNIINNEYVDKDLKRDNCFKVSYTGSIRLVNNLGLIVDAAKILNKGTKNNALILVWGDGDEKEKLERDVKENNLSNIIFKGKVKKEQIPSILSQSDLSLLHNSSTSLDIYGQSQNKFFEYLGAGKPILMTYSVGHSVVKEKKCGIELENQTADKIAEAILKFCSMSKEEYNGYCIRAKETAKEYDFKILTDKLIEVIERL